MISSELARQLRDTGLVWHPASGDAFRIDRDEFDSDIFTISDLTVEAHQFDTGTILGFNGTTEWALDSVALEDALWMPREDQLRELLGGTFRTLSRLEEGTGFRVATVLNSAPAAFDACLPEDAYAAALLALLEEVRG
jgi:hypothetical protein